MTNAMKTQVHRQLAACPIFQGATEVQCSALLDKPDVYIKKIARYDILFSPETFERQLVLVLKGSVQVKKNDVVMSTLCAGDVTGAVTMYSNEDYFVTHVAALTEATVLFIGCDSMDALLSESPRVAKNFISYLTQRIYFLNRKIDGFTSQGAARKLALFLLETAPAQGEVMKLPFSLTQLAERLNVSRASLYRAFDEMERQGVLEKHGKEITLLAEEALRSYC